MEQNKVSIIIPVYNRFIELQNALASVFNDETICFDIEVIVVNDGSTDGDYNLLASDKVFVFNQTNQGVGAARNKGISLSKGEYLFFLDADDEFVEGSLMTCPDNKCPEITTNVAKLSEKNLLNFYPRQTLIRRAHCQKVS